MLENLTSGFVELKKEEVLETVKARIGKGDDVLDILDEARRAMTVVGERFQDGTFFLAEMMLSAEIFKGAINILQPHLEKARPREPIGTMVLATPRGDIHDLGKDIFATLLVGQGFEVHNMGVDVEPGLIVEKVKEIKPDFLGFSALITTAFASMKKTTDLLKQEHLRDSFKLLVGGGVTNSTLKDYIGADFQTIDAMEGVSYCMDIMVNKNSKANGGPL